MIDILSKIKAPKKITVFILCFAVLILVEVVLFSVLYKGKSNLKLENLNGSETENLLSLDSCAKKSIIKKSDYANYKFTEKQKELIKSYFDEFNSVSIVIRTQIFEKSGREHTGYSDNSFKYGFLYDSSFSARGKFIDKKNKKENAVSVIADENDFDLIDGKYTFDVSFAIKKNMNGKPEIPEGFFVFSEAECKILACCVVPSELGFDTSSDIPFYGFSCNGGKIKSDNSVVDFTGGALIYPAQNSNGKLMPEILIKLYDDEIFDSTLENSIRVKMKVGGETIFVKCTKNAKELIIPCGALNTGFPVIELSDNKAAVSALIMRNASRKSCAVDENISNTFKIDTAVDVLEPIKTDPGLILKYNSKNWRTRDYEIFEWDRLPGILFFDTRNYKVQDNFFRRLAFYIEKAGYKGRLVTNEELGDMHGFNALDYRAESLADFFNKAVEIDFQLNKEEEILKNILLYNGILLPDTENELFVKPGYGAIVSISQESNAGLRVQLMAHEAWHMLFFIDEEFRNYVAAVYYTMDEFSRNFLIDYFKSQTSLGYDVEDDYLMHNEFMAYILQSPKSYVGTYFVNHANWATVKKYTPILSDYIIRTKAQGFVDSAEMLESFVFDKYGVICGSLNLIQR